MKEPIFVSLEQVLQLHEMSLRKHGGLNGIRDKATLMAAVAQPQHTFYYGGDLFDVAAAYAYHIAQSQAFLDGNKRTGIAAALAFLAINGRDIRFDSDPIYDAMIAIAERQMEKPELAAILRDLVVS